MSETSHAPVQRIGKLSLTTRLILFFILLLAMTMAVLGTTAYFVARNELDKKGEQILRNAVAQALDLIESEYAGVSQSDSAREDAQERIKQILQGPRQDDGTRTITSPVDLGAHGYFIIYDSAGNEIMHPELEGSNVWEVQDPSKPGRFLVQEQIAIAMDGGGFHSYSWNLPGSDEIDEKISYGSYFAPWDWIVVATSYRKDFNRGATTIWRILFMSTALLTLIVSGAIVIFVRQRTSPLSMLAESMALVPHNRFESVPQTHTGDEVDELIAGYNHMITSLSDTRLALEAQTDYLRFIAYHDELTGLFNRHGLESRIDARIQEIPPASTLFLSDIIGLKAANASLGFEQGDRLLTVIAGYFEELKQEGITAGRSGSNEFCFWIEDSRKESLEARGERIRQNLRTRILSAGFNLNIDLHFAFSAYPDQGRSFRMLYEKSSNALRFAKENQIFTPLAFREEMRKSFQEELALQNQIRKALERGEFMVHYQKQIDLLSGRVMGLEALARWESPSLGRVSPAVFIPALSKMNAMKAFSNYMIPLVFSHFSRLQAKFGPHVRISINISPPSFLDPLFVPGLLSQMSRYNIPSGLLTLELTEDVLIADFESIERSISVLRNAGVRIAIDDFGTGYSSLNYLTRLEIDELKIDRSFIMKICEDKKSFHLLQTLCTIGEIYDYQLVAEGVETEQQLEHLRRTPIRCIQGFIYSRPEPLD